jgi:hypothetical protein
MHKTTQLVLGSTSKFLKPNVEVKLVLWNDNVSPFFLNLSSRYYTTSHHPLTISFSCIRIQCTETVITNAKPHTFTPLS